MIGIRAHARDPVDNRRVLAFSISGPSTCSPRP